ncbi:MAG: substrate-binding domain-containing protein, partial [Verrucomicrobiota bacterium]
NYLAPVHLSDTLGRFRRAHPNCDLSLVLGMSSEMLEALDRGELDLVIANPEGAKGRLLWEDKLVWIGKESLCVEEEEEVDLVLMPSPCSYRALAFDLLTKVGRAWKMSIEANSVEAVCSAVDAGLGVSVLPFSAVADRETIIEGILPELPNTSVMSFSNPDSPNPYLERFLEILLDSIES